jgi:hypothetical protein
MTKYISERWMLEDTALQFERSREESLRISL